MDYQNFKSVMATGHNKTDRFAFIPTTRVIDILEKERWMPIKVTEKRCHKEVNIGFQNHLIRFRRQEDMELEAIVNEMVPEIILKNAHDGTSQFQIMAGLYRFICANGMIIADSTFATHKIKHIGFQDQNVIDAVFDVVKTTPLIMSKVQEFKEIILNKNEQLVYAESALTAKYGNKENVSSKFNLPSLITPIRNADMFDARGNNTLWNTFNVIQEKLVERGGRFAVKQTSRVGKSRGINSVTENVRVNQALWMLTEKMAELKH